MLKPKPDDLEPGRPRRSMQPASFIERTRGVAPNLPTAGLGDALRGYQHHSVRRNAQHRVDTLYYFRLDTAEFAGLRRPGFGYHYQALGTGLHIDRAKGRYTTTSHTRHVGGCRLDFLGNDVAAGLDNQVLGTASHKQFVVGPVGEVSRIHPPIFSNNLSRGLWVAEIT